MSHLSEDPGVRLMSICCESGDVELFLQIFQSISTQQERQRLVNELTFQRTEKNLLHLAAQNGFVEIIDVLLSSEEKFEEMLFSKMMSTRDDEDKNCSSNSSNNKVENFDNKNLKSKEENSKAFCNEKGKRIFRDLLGGRTVLDQTCLHCAAGAGQILAIEAILRNCESQEEQEALINAVDFDGSTILHYAVFENRIELIQQILARDVGDDNNSSGEEEEQEGEGEQEGEEEEEEQFYDAQEEPTGTIHILTTLLENNNNFKGVLAKTRGAGKNILFYAAESSKFDAFKVIMESCSFDERCALINDVDSCGDSILHKAITVHHMDAVSAILGLMGQQAGFNRLFHRNNKNGDGDGMLSALHLAVKLNRIDAAKVLLLQGCKNDPLTKQRFGCLQDAHGWTALHFAVRNSNLEMIRLLLEECSGKHEERQRQDQSGYFGPLRIGEVIDNLGMTVLHRMIVEGFSRKDIEEWRNSDIRRSFFEQQAPTKEDKIRVLLGFAKKEEERKEKEANSNNDSDGNDDLSRDSESQQQQQEQQRRGRTKSAEEEEVAWFGVNVNQGLGRAIE